MADLRPQRRLIGEIVERRPAPQRFGLPIQARRGARIARRVLPRVPDERLESVGVDVTVPVPVPMRVTLSGKLVVTLKVAVTVRAAVIVTVQAPVPVHAPLQPAKVEPAAAVAASVTDVPLANAALHVVPQLIPAGVEVTVPAPAPDFVTVRPREVEGPRICATASVRCSLSTS